MTDNVQSILGARLDRLIKERFNLNTLKAYSYKAMDEYGVNAKNEQAIRATRAMTDNWAKSEEIKFNGIEDLCEAYENYPEESIRNARCDKIMEGYDWDCEAYWAQKMEEHGVDTEDEQAIRAINAMADVWNKAMDMSENTMEGLSNAVENHAKLQKKGV
jgi:hypothetical protein